MRIYCVEQCSQRKYYIITMLLDFYVHCDHKLLYQLFVSHSFQCIVFILSVFFKLCRASFHQCVSLYLKSVWEWEWEREKREGERIFFWESTSMCVYVYMSVYTHINITAIFGVYFNLLYIPRLYYFVYCLSLYLFRLDACNLVLLYKKQKVYIWYKIL